MTISVIIPALGRESLLETMASVREADEILVSISREELVSKVNKLAKLATGDIIVFMSERSLLKPGWKEILLKKIELIKTGVVSFCPNTVQCGAMTRDYYERYGYFFYPGYVHYHGDQELGEVARKQMQYTEMLEMIIGRDKPKPDIGNATDEDSLHDWTLYHQREALGFQ